MSIIGFAVSMVNNKRRAWSNIACHYLYPKHWEVIESKCFKDVKSKWIL